MIKMRAFHAGAAFALLLAAGSVPASAQDDKVDLPGTVSWTSYPAGTSGYNQAVAIGNVLRQDNGTSLRIIPGETDVARLVPVKQGRVDFAASGAGSYYAQEGVFDFAQPQFGPQDIRLLAMNLSDAFMGIVTAADANIKTLEDLKGKRVAWITASPALNQNMTATLAFAGLTWDDVQKVEFPGFRASMEGIIQDRVDAAVLIATSGSAREIEASPRGIYWPAYPFDNEEGWKRLKAVAPVLVKWVGTLGAGIDGPREGMSMPLPILVSYANIDNDLAYNMTKAIYTYYDEYKDAAPGAGGWALKNQLFDWGIPFADGAIRYYKEAGVWTDELNTMNQGLIERQKVLQDAWKSFTTSYEGDDAEFQTSWMKARADALTAAGMDPIWQ